MRKRFLLIILALFCISISGCQKTYRETYQKDIDEINFYHGSFGTRSPEYKIDLKNKKFWEYISPRFDNRDSSAENEGYTFVCDLEDEKIEEFLRESARYGFTLWEESYMDESIVCGSYWGTTITFYDSTTLTVYGNDYPKTWGKMRKAF